MSEDLRRSEGKSCEMKLVFAWDDGTFVDFLGDVDTPTLVRLLENPLLVLLLELLRYKLLVEVQLN